VAAGDHDLSAVLPGRHEVGNELWRILEITVEKNDCVALGLSEAGGDRRLVAKVA
jgi:hypothetical protein